MRQAVDVAVIGGGVIGCSIAYHVARRGASVVLLESDQIGAGASGAAAGMLAAQAEAHAPGPFLELLLRSRSLYPSFIEELREESGLDVEYIRSGTLLTAKDPEELEALRSRDAWQEELGLNATWLSTSELLELEPAISTAVTGGFYLPDDAQVNTSHLLTALVIAASRNGAVVQEFTRATGFITAGDRVVGVHTVSGDVHASVCVLAGGAFSSLLLSDLGISLPVYPVKGEILAVSAGSDLLNANIFGNSCYLVPKRDGRVVIGATEEPGVYDRRPTLGGVSGLSQEAISMVPELAHAPFISAWGGLRPATPDRLPVLGPADGWEGLLLATGHYRNGVLLAPVTGSTLAALTLDQEPEANLTPFSAGRFTQEKLAR